MMKVPHHNLPDHYELKDTLETDILTVYFYGQIVVVEAKEGALVSYKTAFPILVAGLKYIGTKPWIYIANRIHSYSVNPNDYVYLEKIPTLKGLAIVSSDPLARQNAKMESLFFKKPFACYQELEKAIEWSDQLLS